MKDYNKYITFAQEAGLSNKERNDNYRKKGQGEGYLMGRYFNGEIGAIDEEVKRLGMELNALLKHMGIDPNENGDAGQLKSLVPTGSIITLAHRNIPSGYLECNGTMVSKNTYSDLYAAIGKTYATEGFSYADDGKDGTYAGDIDLSYVHGSWKFEKQTVQDGITGSSFVIDSKRKVFYFELKGSKPWHKGSNFIHIDTVTTNAMVEAKDCYLIGVIKRADTDRTLRNSEDFKVAIKKSLDGQKLTLRLIFTADDYEELVMVRDTVNDPVNKFYLPDYRGMFLRGFDNGANIDKNRAMGHKQLDAGRNVTGGMIGVLFNCYSTKNIWGSFGVSWEGNTKISQDNTWDDPVRDIKMDASGSWGDDHVAEEFRPVNLPVVYAIKY